MSETLEALERKWETLYRKSHDVGDFRQGMVSDNFRRCGKSNSKTLFRRPVVPVSINGESNEDA